MNLNYALLVTVYITSHNYARFIEQAIESVLRQTMQNFELIVIDDGSTDNSREIIEGYASDKKVIPIFQHNKGLNVTNNIALRAARGKYVMRLDADDWLDEHMLEVLSGVLERNPDVGLVFSDYYHTDEDGNVLEQVRRHNFDEVTLRDQPAHGACTMIRRQCLSELEGYDESFACQDGYDLWVRFIEHYDVRNINLPLFYYRQHQSSLTRDEEKILNTRQEILKRQASARSERLSTVAIVPIRGPILDPASPALNVLGDRALMDWTLEAAIGADGIDDVIVTTPDQDLLDHLRATYANEVIALHRDPSLALANTYIEDTLLDALDRYEGDHSPPAALMLLSIEAPFRTSRHIDSAIDVMAIFETDLVVGVRPETGVFYQHNGASLVPIRKTSGLRLERDELYREVGQMQLISTKFLRRTRSLDSDRVGHVVLDQWAALSLMTQFDWQIAEARLNSITDAAEAGAKAP